MRQFSLRSLLGAKTARAGLICKTALWTLPRCGKAAFLLLTLGFYLLFPAWDTWQAVRSERQEPYELTAAVSNAYLDLPAVLQIEGVDRVTPVIAFDGALECGDKELSCPVRAVYSQYPSLDLLEGMRFPDSTNMPFLVLSRTAAEALGVSANAEISLNGQKATVCGIFETESDLPAAYMGYDTASRLFPQSGPTTLMVSLRKGDGEAAVKALRRFGLTASFDQNESLRWSLMEQQAGVFLLASVGFLACTALLIRAVDRQASRQRRAEQLALRLSGLTGRETRRIAPLRYALMGLLSLLLAAMAAGIA